MIWSCKNLFTMLLYNQTGKIVSTISLKGCEKIAMVDQNGNYCTTVAPDGRELVTIGTPEFPAQMWGPWEGDSYRCNQVPWHWHEEMEMSLITRSVERMTVDGHTFDLKPGQGVFINSGVMHGSVPAPGYDYLDHVALVFHPSVVGGASGSVFWQKYLGPLSTAPECRCVVLLGETEWERQALAALWRMADLWAEKQPGYEFAIRTELSKIVFLIKENCVRHAPAPSERELRDAERIKQMVDFVRSHREENITTEQIAASAAISVSECLRCFRRMMDLTPKEYLRQHRIRHAAQLLEQTDMSITAIGETCGFEDMSYFARVFRAEKGCTPSEYRSMGR